MIVKKKLAVSISHFAHHFKTIGELRQIMCEYDFTRFEIKTSFFRRGSANPQFDIVLTSMSLRYEKTKHTIRASILTNKDHQEETHSPPHKFCCLFLDL